MKEMGQINYRLNDLLKFRFSYFIQKGAQIQEVQLHFKTSFDTAIIMVFTITRLLSLIEKILEIFPGR